MEGLVALGPLALGIMLVGAWMAPLTFLLGMLGGSVFIGFVIWFVHGCQQNQLPQ